MQERYGPAMEERFSVLETKVAYHEDNLAELNRVIYRQEQRIEALEAQLKRMTEHFAGSGISSDPSRHEKPPHY
jgi:SlyX protein